MKIPFTKMSGAGNDFIVVDNRNAIISKPSEFSQAVCNRRLGIGADGILLIEKSDISDFTMKYYNADGSNAGMCGNGGRCIAKYAFDNKIVTHETFSFEGFGHIYSVSRIDPTTYALSMKNPICLILNQNIEFEGKILKGNYLNTGTDHSIIFLDDNPEFGSLESVDVFALGRSIRYHPVYSPKGTNVNFVSCEGSNVIKIRTYERGVEDETLACGTGSVASALLSSLKYTMVSPVSVIVQSGETLEISFERSETQFRNVILKGSATITFTGEIDV